MPKNLDCWEPLHAVPYRGRVTSHEAFTLGIAGKHWQIIISYC